MVTYPSDIRGNDTLELHRVVTTCQARDRLLREREKESESEKEKGREREIHREKEREASRRPRAGAASQVP